jgi:hypothetical protein
MKKILFGLLLFLGLSTITNAQELGVRFGDVSGGNAAIDVVFPTAKFSRVHADVSIGNGVGIDVLWDFLYKPLGVEALNWYAGVGPFMRIDDPFYLGVVGELGLEYRFKSVPIVLGGDWRPGFSIIESTNFHGGGFGINVRWNFGQK